MLRRPARGAVSLANSEDDVARFQDDQQVYALLGGMFQDMLADESAGPRLRAIGGTVQWQMRRPNARITVRLGEGVEPGVDFGDTKVRPEVVLTLDAETAHRFWAGELPMHVALSQGLIRAKGPVATILKVVPAVGPGREFYAARLAGGGTTVVVTEEAPAEEAAAPEAPAAEEGPAEEAAAPEAPAAEEAPAEEAAAPEAPAAEEALGEEAAADEPEAVVEAAPAAEPEAVAEDASAAGEAPAEEPAPEAQAEPEDDPPAAS